LCGKLNLCAAQLVYFACSPDSKRRRPAPVSARTDMLPKRGNTSRTYPAAIKRSRCASGIVTRVGLSATCFSEANSWLVSRLSCRDKDRVGRRLGIIANIQAKIERAPWCVLLYIGDRHRLVILCQEFDGTCQKATGDKLRIKPASQATKRHHGRFDTALKWQAVLRVWLMVTPCHRRRQAFKNLSSGGC